MLPAMRAVLVVDDNADILNAVSEALTDEGWDVIAVTSSEEATSAAQSRKIDVVLCDVLLNNDTDGLALRDAFARQGLGHLPFVFISASRRAGARLDRELFLQKPFTVSDVVSILNTALARQENGRAAP